MWSRSAATFQELVSRGTSHCSGHLQGCVDTLSKSLPSQPLLHNKNEEKWCVIVMMNVSFILKELVVSINSMSWWRRGGGRYCWLRVNVCGCKRSKNNAIKDFVCSLSVEKSGRLSFECETDNMVLMNSPPTPPPGWKHRSSSLTWQKLWTYLQMWKFNSTVTHMMYVILLYA